MKLLVIPEGVYSSMRKLFALMLVLMLLPVAPVFAEDAELPLPAATLTPEEWAKQSMGEDSPLSIEVVPYDELPRSWKGSITTCCSVLTSGYATHVPTASMSPPMPTEAVKICTATPTV